MKRRNLVLLGAMFLVLMAPVYANAMHIMEGFLPPMWAGIWALLCLPFILRGFSRISSIVKDAPEKKLLLALVGAFAFVLSAMKLPSVTGSCSHPTGVGLGAILFGPTVTSVLGLIVLIFQAVLLAHGGLTTLGANVFSMAIVGPLVSFFIFKIVGKNSKNKGVPVFLAASLGDLATYTITSIQLALAFPDPTGGFAVSLAKFLGIFAVTQIPLAIAEGILTVIVYNLLVEYRKEGGVTLEELS